MERDLSEIAPNAATLRRLCLTPGFGETRFNKIVPKGCVTLSHVCYVHRQFFFETLSLDQRVHSRI